MPKDRADELAELEKLADGLLVKLSPAARTALLRRIVADIRRSQRLRIARQQNPDGSAFEARKPRARREPISRPIRFLYRKPSGKTRVADLKSWQDQGGYLTGYDREAEDIRTFKKARIAVHLPPSGDSDTGPMTGGIRGRAGGIKRKAAAMFGRIRGAAFLKSGVEGDSGWVGFTGRAARIARIHQDGLRDRVSEGGPEVKYPQRRLLGFSQADREAMLDALLGCLQA